MFVPRGRQDRTCVVVDVRKSKTADEADLFLQINPGKDFEALWILRALAAGLRVDAATVAAETGVPLAAWQDLMDRMKQARFGVILYGEGVTMTHGRHLNAEAVLALTCDMNAYTRFICKPMRGHGNIAGADNVLTWRTGYPFGVNHSRGYPRYNPGEYTAAEMLARGEADAAMFITGDPLSEFGQPVRDHLAKIPYITIDSKETPTSRAASVAFCTATYGINTAGTVYRMDDVPIPLRPAVDSPYTSEFEVLSRIEKRVLELKRRAS